MRASEQGFLLLTSYLGNPERRPLTVAQFRILAERVRSSDLAPQDRELVISDLRGLGYGEEMASRIVELLRDTQLLFRYLQLGKKAGCVPMSRISDAYPEVLRQKLGLESPGCIWTKGDISLLDAPLISLVGSRDIRPENRDFAWEAGFQAAKQGYTLVSGNARGADRIAQSACLKNGGRVISVVADALADKDGDERILYLSEDGFDQAFSAQRAISRNRLIHTLTQKTFVAQCDFRSGGTWDGTVKNLRNGWSPVFCFDDGSPAVSELQQMGAKGIRREDLSDLRQLHTDNYSLFDQ